MGDTPESGLSGRGRGFTGFSAGTVLPKQRHLSCGLSTSAERDQGFEGHLGFKRLSLVSPDVTSPCLVSFPDSQSRQLCGFQKWGTMVMTWPVHTWHPCGTAPSHPPRPWPGSLPCRQYLKSRKAQYRKTWLLWLVASLYCLLL